MVARLRSFIGMLRALFRRDRLEDRLRAELQSHVEMLADKNIAAGMPPEEARREARIAVGGFTQVREDVRDARGFGLLEDLVHDVRYGLRQLRRSPGFTGVAVVTLALGIGANTALFTLIDAVLLKMLPVRNPQELVMLRWAVAEGRGPTGARWMDGRSWTEQGRLIGTSFSHVTYQEMRSRGTGDGRPLSGAFAFTDIRDVNVIANEEAALAAGQLVSADYFQVLGVQPALGRTFVESDDRPGAPPVCVISDRYWKKRFGGDPSTTGRAITVNGAPTTIIGVTPPDFFGVQPGSGFDIALPLSAEPLVLRLDPKVSLLTAGDHWWVQIMGRLNVGGDERQALAVLGGIFQQTTADEGPTPAWKTGAPTSLEVEPGGMGITELRRQFSRPLLILMAMVGLVLAIACVNVANLLLARAAVRQRDIGIRLSLGASRWRLVRQLLTESVLLACLGGAAGCVLALWGSRLLLMLISPPDNPILLDLSPNLRILGFAGAACLITGLLFGLAPAFRSTRVDLAPAVKGIKPSLRRGRSWLTAVKTLVIAQASLSLVLMFGAALFVRTLVNLQSLNPGFAQNDLLLFRMDATQAGYKDRALRDFYDGVRQRIAALPGVVSATSSLHPMLGGGTRRDRVSVPGYEPKPGERMAAHVMPAGPDFFKTMRIPLLLGRDFTERDKEDAPKIAVVNETFAKRYLGERNPVGQRIGLGGQQIDTEIVGVAADARYGSLRREIPATVYHPFRQASIHMMHFEVRTASDPKALIPDVRRVAASLDRTIPLHDLRTQEEKIEELLIQERLFAKLSAFFGLLALALVGVGMYGILAYWVARRMGEIGLRMALGAKRGTIVSMVLKETMLVTTVGVVLGISGAFGAARLAGSVISDRLYGLQAVDTPSLVVAMVALIAAAALASFVPAHRASRVDPMIALRHE